MSKIWKMRHAGATDVTSNLRDVEIMEGLQEGVWETTDEVRGPSDAVWQSLEEHPHFAEAVSEYSPPIAYEKPDESKLDMNPLIDVALVLLVFFILTTTYESLRKVIDIPETNPPEEVGKKSPIPIVEPEELVKLIRVTARDEGGKIVVKVNDDVVPIEEIEAKLADALKRSDRPEILLDTQAIPWGVEVAIMDAAKGAGVQQILKRARIKE